MANEPITGQPYQEAGSKQTDAVQNSTLNYFGAWVNCAVQSIGDTVPPGSPVNGQRFIVGASATGAWATHDGEMAVYRDGWQFHAPPAAGVPIIKNLDDGTDWECVAGVWAAKAGGGGGAEDVDYDNSASGLAATNVQDAIDEIATGGGGGGDLEKIGEVVVTGSAVTDIDFSSLNLDADRVYQMEVIVAPGATGAHIIAMYLSGDTTNGNYYSQLGYFLTTIAGGSGAANANIFLNNSLPNTSTTYSFTVKLMKVAGHNPTATSIGVAVHNDGAPFFSSYAYRHNSTANVTSIKLRNTIANGFGVGTVARLYRLN